MKVSAIIRIIIWTLVALIFTGILVSAIFFRDLFSDGWSIGINSTTFYTDADSYSIGGGEIDASDIDSIELTWICGEVKFEIYDGDKISISESGEINNDDDKLRYLVKDKKLIIQFEKSKNFEISLGNTYNKKTLTLKLPKSLAENLNTVDIENVSSNITMNDIKLNKLDIENVSGEVKMKNITAIDISLETVSGGADTENIIAKNLNCNTVSGNLKMRGSFTDVDAESVSGDIEVYSKEKVNSADVETVSGDFEITIPENSGFTVDMDSTKKLSSAFETTNRGDLIISGDGSAEFDFETVSGQFSIKK